MCNHGDEVLLWVPIPADLSHTGKFRWDKKGIDTCIAPLVDALNRARIFTESCCCGHGEMLGHIWLQDGRVLVVLPSGTTKDGVMSILSTAPSAGGDGE